MDIKILLILAVKVSKHSKKSVKVHNENKDEENEKDFEFGKIYENIKKGMEIF